MARRIIQIYDERFNDKRRLAAHAVPADWDEDRIFKHFGIGKHLTVIEQDGQTDHVLQQGRYTP